MGDLGLDQSTRVARTVEAFMVVNGPRPGPSAERRCSTSGCFARVSCSFMISISSTVRRPALSAPRQGQDLADDVVQQAADAQVDQFLALHSQLPPQRHSQDRHSVNAGGVFVLSRIRLNRVIASGLAITLSTHSVTAARAAGVHALPRRTSSMMVRISLLESAWCVARG